ncbi:hypothetical protein BBJ28_00002099 [Nothophytophthora sp. Chile5]|nr:hypothetical protein BBJ28_00002099 [Nothophytophthora sp. Chile5]
MRSDGFLLLYDMEIARDTAARAQDRRRKEGLVELEENARLPTRSGLQGPSSPNAVDAYMGSNQVEFGLPEQSRPVPSKLIDSLFGATYGRRRGGDSETVAGRTASPRSRPVRATGAHATENVGQSVVSVEDLRKGPFGEVSYLPAVVYPFIKIFQENDLAAFEASISVMLHWCGDFLVSLPYPPVFVLSALEKELERKDAQLYDHFLQYGVTPEAFAWSLLKTIFTEVLSEDEWLCLWDHLLTYPDTPQLLFVAVLAYLAYFRTALLAASDLFSIEQFFHQQNAINVQKFVQLMMNLREKLDLSKFSLTQDSTEASSSGGGRAPYWPLPRGQYPAFAHYPRFVVDFQISVRAELEHKQKLLGQVEEESGRLKAKHEEWLKEKKLVLEAEEKRRKEAIAAEKERMLHLKTLDYETRKRRLEHLSHMETSAHETLEETSKMLQTEYQRLESTLAMQKERMEFEISSRKQEEDLQRIEFETQKRVVGIHKQREMEERLSRLRTEFETRVKQQELQDLLKFESWKREDEEQKLQAKMQLQRQEELALLTQETRVRQELENQLLDQQLAKDKELLDLESVRNARRQEQQEHDAMDHEFETRQNEPSLVRERSKKFKPRAQKAAEKVPRRQPSGPAYESPELTNENRNRRLLDADSENENEGKRTDWNLPSGDEEEDQARYTHASSPHPPEKADLRFVASLASAPGVLEQPSREPPSSGSSVSFGSAAMRRTMQEMSLLERALGDVSSSMSSSSGDTKHGHVGGAERGDGAPSVAERSIEGHRWREEPQEQAEARVNAGPKTSRSTPLAASEPPQPQDEEPAYLSRFDVEYDAGETSNTGVGNANADTTNEEGPDDEDGDHANALDALQRPIAELEKKLGIRFDEFSDEEKESDNDSFEALHDSEEDETIEDDRARLLQRAKKLLEAESFDTDSDDDV